jgi:iron complex transport system substrate-binding protein
MRIKFRVQVSGFRFQGGFGWLVAVLLVLGFGEGLADDKPRVISLAPHLTELAFAAGVGETLVGTVEWSDFPPAAEELPRVGDAFRYDLEVILGLDPDYALAWRGGSPVAAVERIESLGVDIIWIEVRSLDDIASALETLGDRLQAPEAGTRAAEAFRGELEDLRARHAGSGDQKTVFYQVSARPLYTLGRRHVINEVFKLCGLNNIFADLDTEAAVIDMEAVLAAEPDLIVASYETDDTDPLARWRDTRLVSEERTQLHRVEPSLLVRPTPRIIQGIEHVCSLAR